MNIYCVCMCGGLVYKYTYFPQLHTHTSQSPKDYERISNRCLNVLALEKIQEIQVSCLKSICLHIRGICPRCPIWL